MVGSIVVPDGGQLLDPCPEDEFGEQRKSGDFAPAVTTKINDQTVDAIQNCERSQQIVGREPDVVEAIYAQQPESVVESLDPPNKAGPALDDSARHGRPADDIHV